MNRKSVLGLGIVAFVTMELLAVSTSEAQLIRRVLRRNQHCCCGTQCATQCGHCGSHCGQYSASTGPYVNSSDGGSHHGASFGGEAYAGFPARSNFVENAYPIQESNTYAGDIAAGTYASISGPSAYPVIGSVPMVNIQATSVSFQQESAGCVGCGGGLPVATANWIGGFESQIVQQGAFVDYGTIEGQITQTGYMDGGYVANSSEGQILGCLNGDCGGQTLGCANGDCGGQVIGCVGGDCGGQIIQSGAQVIPSGTFDGSLVEGQVISGGEIIQDDFIQSGVIQSGVIQSDISFDSSQSGGEQIIGEQIINDSLIDTSGEVGGSSLESTGGDTVIESPTNDSVPDAPIDQTLTTDGKEA